MAPAPDNGLPERDRRKYLLDGETVIFAVNEHWSRIAEPVVTLVATLVLAVYVDATVPNDARIVANVCWWLWFAAIARALFLAFEWRHTWFIATDKRMLRIFGLVDRQVAMMPLAKITDLRYHRTVPGRVLGYGTFVIESPGQNQALDQVQYVPHPDTNYRALVAEIFGIPDGGRAVVETDEPAPAYDELDDEAYEDGYDDLDEYEDGHEDGYDHGHGAYEGYEPYETDEQDRHHDRHRDEHRGHGDRYGDTGDRWTRRGR